MLTRNLPVTDSLERLVTSAHLPAATGLRAKLALARRMSSGAREVADEVRADCARSLVSQRELCPPPLKRVGDELICAKALGLLPLFTQAVTRAVVRAGWSEARGVGGLQRPEGGEVDEQAEDRREQEPRLKAERHRGEPTGEGGQLRRPVRSPLAVRDGSDAEEHQRKELIVKGLGR